MRKNLATLVWALVIFGSLGYFMFRGLVANNTPVPPKTDTIIVVDTFWRDDTTKAKPYKPKKATVIVDTFWKYHKVDTNAILQAYHNKNAYNDTLANDSALLVVVNDTICQNQIASRSHFIVRHYPIITKTNTVTVYPDYNNWYVGLYAGQSVGAEITYLKNKAMYSVGGGTNGVYLKLSFKIK